MEMDITNIELFTSLSIYHKICHQCQWHFICKNL